VSKPAPIAAPPKRFDLQKFETMLEPFSVRIEKVKGSMKYEIPMPQSEGDNAPGTGLSKDQVRGLQDWLVNQWSGGGHYTFAIVDASSPPQVMEWTAFYPPTEFPEKIPPTLQGAFVPHVPVPGSVAAAHPNNQQRVQQSMAQYPGGALLPPASAYQSNAPAIPVGHPGYYPPVPFGYSTPIAQPAASGSSEVQVLREALARSQQDAMQRDFERKLAEIKTDSDRRYVEMQQSMQAMIEKMTTAMQAQARAVPTVDPAVEGMRETIRRLEEDNRRQMEAAERHRRETEMRDAIKAAQDQTAGLVEESNRRFEAFMASNTNKGPDPQMMLFQQILQSQMEATKEIARTSQSQFDRMQNLMMRPQDVLAMAKESSTGTDHAVSNMARQWEQMFAISRQLTEQAAQLNSGGGGNEVIGLVRDGIEKVGSWAERYTGSKAKENIAQVNAQAEVARAQADVTKAQLEGMKEAARLEASLKSGAVVQMPDGSFRAGPGATQAQIPAKPMGVPWKAQKAPAASSGLGGNVVPISDGAKIKGRTDQEWFGLILPNVKQLRAEVDAFIEGLKESPPAKKGASPDEAALAIQMAATEVMNRQIPIPAMIDLLLEHRVADFLDVLLPNAPQEYRDDVVKLLMNEEPEEDDDDDDDDEGEGDETAPQASA
jgi:hypothetical protein